MISPETFARTHTRRAMDVIRVSLERSGVIGFIDIHDSMTLLDARSVITENVENAPPAFQFVLDDGAPVSARQESTQKISYYYPCVKIRECTPRALKPTSPAAASSVMMAQSDESSLNNDGHGSTMEKICVQNGAGDECLVWISEEYTFQQLRRDACRYWNLPATHVALTDAEGCLWPEQAKILAMISVDELHRKKVVVDYRNGASGNGGSGTGLGNASTHHRTKQLARTKSLSTSRATISFNRHSVRAPLRSDSSNAKILMRPLAITTSDDPATMTSMVPKKSLVEELWLVFTFYCVNGDSLELECIKAHQFNKLLRDSRLSGGLLTPAMADIIYTSETKGKPQSSGKMNYDEFLNALLKISTAKHKPSSSKQQQALRRETSDDEALFQKLVVDNILPLASRWPTHMWEMHTQQLRKPEIVSFISKFLEPLLEIFMFYAKSHLVNPARGGVKELYMSYADYQRFFNDFAFANLQLSSVDAAQVFLASCSSSPFHDALLLSTLADASGAGDSEPLGTSGAGDTIMLNSASSLVGAASIRRILESVEGVVTYAFPETQIGRICMGVSAFLDALGRIGLTAFARLHAIKTIHCVKAVFHHVSRGLTRSRVHEILNNHSSTSIHATKFYSGTVAFNNKFLDMWRYEGSPDYLSGSLYSPSDAAVKDSKASTGLPGNGATMASSMVGTPVYPVGLAKGEKHLIGSVVDTVNASVNLSANHLSDSAIEQQVDGTLSVTTESKPSRGAEAHFMEISGDDVDAAQPIDAGIGDNAQKSDANEDVEVRPVDLSGDSFRASTTGNLQGRVSPSGGAPVHHATVAAAPSLALLHHQHRDDERGLFESILLKGGVFKKYGQWGNPHRRYVWCAKDFDAVFWRPLNRKNHLSKEGIAVASIIAVLPGNSPRTRYAFMKHLSEEKSLCRCFSVVAEDRRLDLEADSETTRDLWVNAFLYLMKEYRPRMLVA
uniref:PH domain-containing protein n=1 Tax=Globisporangium ultimum (strain ATCC 200006 / CBS 805.95 / DAOM BR144) TaxID=431595 RepID=K3X6M1_GLOUD